ncbi:unnamed protein product [Trifolium pratense]|uniref:Uncharacterized protein n=1 Tax=Trifolium pratense TaxID=57577 RepID=A0ACB0IX05_TRIPR|nr:unnamed protein product [Trifolium pratense]
MRCTEESKLTLGTYVLREEANKWWKNAKLRMGIGGVVITWEMFKGEFLRKYFPADISNKKVVEFMELKQGNMSVAEYSVKFEELCAFSPHYNTVEAENDKCVKFEKNIKECQKTDKKLMEKLAIVVEEGKEANFKVDENGVVRFHGRVCVPDVPEMKKMILEEGHRSGMSIHPGVTKMYQDLKKLFWWPGMKRQISEFVYACLVCQKSKIEHQKPSGLLQPLFIPEWKWDSIAMDFVGASKGNNFIGKAPEPKKPKPSSETPPKPSPEAPPSLPGPSVSSVDLDSRTSKKEHKEEKKLRKEEKEDDEASKEHYRPIPDGDFEIVQFGGDPAKGEGQSVSPTRMTFETSSSSSCQGLTPSSRWEVQAAGAGTTTCRRPY